MTTIQMAAGYAQMGAGEAFICAGVASMTRIPMGGFNPMPNPALGKTYPQAYMGIGEAGRVEDELHQIHRRSPKSAEVATFALPA